MRYLQRIYHINCTTNDGGEIAFDGTKPEHLRVKFQVSHDTSGAFSTAVIDIYNLNNQNKRQLTTANKRGGKIFLQAGYASCGLGGIFQGDIINAVVIREGANWITRIFAMSNVERMKQLVTPRSFAKNITLGEVLKVICEEMKLPYELIDIPESRMLASGYQISSSFQHELERLCDANKIVWYSENNRIIIKANNAPLRKAPIVVSELHNGLIHTPSVSSTSMTFDTHLNGAIQLSDTVNLQARSPSIQFSGAFFVDISDYISPNGEFVVYKIMHEGDTHGDDTWSTTHECYVGELTSSKW